jgi:hypothetical protein
MMPPARSRRVSRSRGPAYCAVAILLGVLFAGGAAPSASPPPAPHVTPAPAPPTEPGSFDEPLRLIAEARRAWEGVADYTCVLIRRERVGGRLQPEEAVQMEARREPFSVHLRWATPRALAKQEACYVAGRNDGRMRVRPAGLLGGLGFLSLDPNDPRAREHSNHTITEAGVGHLIDHFGEEWEAGRDRPARVSAADGEFDGRPCRRVEVAWADEAGGRSVVYFDEERRLPVRAEWYGRGGEPHEVDGYTQMRVNVGLGDADFDY